MHSDRFILGLGNHDAKALIQSDEHTEDVCRNLRIAYRTMSQKEEASLMKQAVVDSDIPNHLDVIHAQGDSIHVITGASENPYLISFGIADLNQQFNLLGAPDQRQIATCVKWLSCRLPASLEQFVYTGGQKTYLRHFQIEIEQNLYCHRCDFTLLTKQLASMDIQELEANSPFDPAWMHRAIASNCVVLAGLIKSGTSKFMPSDLHITHGFTKQL